LKNRIQISLSALASFVLAACSHPLVPVGNGDIISASASRNCLLEDYQAEMPNCDENLITGDYNETYYAIPRAGWQFERWENYCTDTDLNECSFSLPASLVDQFVGGTAAPLRAIFSPLDLIFDTSPSPIDLQGISADFAADISYGDDSANVFDIFLPESRIETPLIIFIHGGGFRGGDKSAAYNGSNSNIVRAALTDGVAFATINYRLLENMGESEGVIKSLSDSQRALQFIRFHAKSFNIDKAKVALYGSSAGAGTSLWIGMKDEAANVRAVDPLVRESTRVLAVGAVETQATYDLVYWETIFAEFGITLELIGTVFPQLVQRLLDFYAISSLDDLFTPDIIAYRQSVDMLDLMTADDPPVWIQNSNVGAGAPTSNNALLHHPYHARELRDRADATGIENVVYIPPLGITDPSGEELGDFLLRHLVDSD